MSKQKHKKRNIRFGEHLLRVQSKSIKFDGMYEELVFATTKLNDIHYIFEETSGYIIGQGENYTRSRNNSKDFLIKTNGKFNEIVNHFIEK
jgi:hypothetical protein